MSRIGKQPVTIPSGVKVAVDKGRWVTVEGPKGKLSHAFPRGITVTVEGNVATVTRDSEKKEQRAFHGMTRALLANMVKGVKEPFEKVLEIHGTGFNAQVNGKDLELDIGFSNKVHVEIPTGIEVKADKGRPVVLRVIGTDKQRVGLFAAVVRSKRPPSPYSDNKGIRYQGEAIRKKAGKAFGEKK